MSFLVDCLTNPLYCTLNANNPPKLTHLRGFAHGLHVSGNSLAILPTEALKPPIPPQFRWSPRGASHTLAEPVILSAANFKLHSTLLSRSFLC